MRSKAQGTYVCIASPLYSTDINTPEKNATVRPEHILQPCMYIDWAYNSTKMRIVERTTVYFLLLSVRQDKISIIIIFTLAYRIKAFFLLYILFGLFRLRA